VSSPPGALINVAELANDPDFAQAFTILRSSGGKFVSGVWQNNQTTIQSYGPISVAKARDLEMIPEGDHVVGAMVFWSAQPLYATNGSGANGEVSDILLWNDHQWRVMTVSQYKDYGFYRAVAVRMSPK